MPHLYRRILWYPKIPLYLYILFSYSLKHIPAIFFAIITCFAFSLPHAVNVHGGGGDTGIDTLLKDKTKKEYLEMRGIVMQSKRTEKGEGKLLDSAMVTIYDGLHKPLVIFRTNKKGKCDFRLPLNQKYTIEVTCTGFVTKFLEVNTKVPDDKKAAYIFPFSIDIFEAVKGLDVSVLKKPIAKVNYSFSQDHFSYDFTYTDRINNELKKMYKNYYFLQTVENEVGADTLSQKTPGDTLHKPPHKK